MGQFSRISTVGAALAALTATVITPAQAQMVTGPDMKGFYTAFALQKGQPAKAGVSAQLIESSVPGNILLPGEQGKWTFQITNAGTAPQTIKGTVEVIAYGTRGLPNDIWVPEVYRANAKPVAVAPFTAKLQPNGFADITVDPVVPARFGAYALIADFGPEIGRRFITSTVRTFAPDIPALQYPSFCLDELPLPMMKRLGIRAIRWGVGYLPTTDPNYEKWYAERLRELKAFQDAGITVIFMAGGGDFNGETQPLGRPRPWLDASGKMLDTKFDLAWKPKYDPDFEKWCYRFAADAGYPKGPINAFALWNEPWEGISISGWGADMIRYRDIFTAMCKGVDAARKNDGVDVLLGGADSTSNALDKFFADGTDTFMPWFDFVSIHYQGLDSGANIKQWRERKNPRGRVKIWDTESWVANTDDRVATVIATNHASGYDRAMGIFGGNIAGDEHPRYRVATGGDANGTKEGRIVHAWSVAASVGAAQHFIGERKFNRLLFQNGLPWVMVFDGIDGKADDGTVVVVGDIGESFGADQLPYRTARGFAENKHKAALRQKLAALPPNTPEKTRTDLVQQIDTPESLSGGVMAVPAAPEYALYDFYGNGIPPRNGKFMVPLDGRGFFLRATSGAKPGACARLLQALATAKVTGIEPLATEVHDFMAPLTEKPPLRITVTNVLNRPVRGKLTVTVGGLTVQNPGAPLQFAANETRVVSLPVTAATPNPGNTYPLKLQFDAGQDGIAEHAEDIHVNLIDRRTIKVDGDLSDWANVLPQTILPQTGAVPTLTEAAWFPFKELPKSVGQSFATGYLAADDTSFYFAARIADETPDPGMVRFETRDDDAFFYPKVVYTTPTAANASEKPEALTWPEDIRRYSYRMDPELPAGNFPNHDNVQIAFNVLPRDQKVKGAIVPGVPQSLIGSFDSDYEFALNPVAPQYGGGTEVWRLTAPNLPHKHYYPRQPKAPGEGPVKNATLVIRREGNNRIVECAIPWSELPAVKQQLDAGKPIKFSFRVNDDKAAGGTMELSRGRSVAKRNGSFQVDWVEHWANELEFRLSR